MKKWMNIIYYNFLFHPCMAVSVPNSSVLFVTKSNESRQQHSTKLKSLVSFFMEKEVIFYFFIPWHYTTVILIFFFLLSFSLFPPLLLPPAPHLHLDFQSAFWVSNYSHSKWTLGNILTLVHIKTVYLKMFPQCISLCLYIRLYFSLPWTWIYLWYIHLCFQKF